MKIIFLGTGTSTGVPEIGCQCEVCTSQDKRDWRLRTSAVIETEGKRILIDCGPDFRWQVITNKIYRLDAVLITHEHSDHISGLGVIARRYGLPIYGTKGTLEAIANTPSVGKIDPSLYRVLEPDMDITIGEIVVHPVRISHDAADPVAYILKNENHKIAIITDLGIYDDYLIEKLQGLDILLLEANHDVRMLEAGSYPYPLKRRILGERGHLSNEVSGQLLGELLHDDMKAVILGHLSKENNYAELAYETVRQEVTLGENPYKGNDFPIYVAKRNEPMPMLCV